MLALRSLGRMGWRTDLLPQPPHAPTSTPAAVVVGARAMSALGGVLATSPPPHGQARRARSRLPARSLITRRHPAAMPAPAAAPGGVAARAAPAGAPANPAAAFEGLEGFGDRSVSEFNIAVLGDLHLDPDAMEPFHQAREQIVRSMHGADGRRQAGARVVQLGDLGSYHHGPGGMGCFERAREYLGGFHVPTATLLGNHDLEGAEFETDEENLAAWQRVFGQRHYWSQDVGPLTLIGLSTVRFRSNPDSVHEVHVDEEQLQFLERALKEAGDRPVAIFTHAPIMGSGLKVVQQVHVKNRCAWLNHSSDPRRFIQIVRDHPNIRLWFSGHFHLSHNYADSVSVVGGCAFVQVGVIGDCNRDGFRQSRVLKGDSQGYRLYTMDHDTGALRLDLAHAWADPARPSPVTPEEELICDPSSGWLCSRVDCSMDYSDASTADLMAEFGGVRWFAAGGNCMLAWQDDILVEYDSAMMAPLGVVAMNIPDGCQVALVDAAGHEVDAMNTDGSAAVAVELRLPVAATPSAPSGGAVPPVTPGAASTTTTSGSSSGGHVSAVEEGLALHTAASGASYVLHERIERNKEGTFYQVFQQNKWRLRKEKEAREAAEAALRAAQQAQQQPEAVGTA